jgi:hypothetical protein
MADQEQAQEQALAPVANPEQNADACTLKLKDQNGEEVLFKTKKTAKLGKARLHKAKPARSDCAG